MRRAVEILGSCIVASFVIAGCSKPPAYSGSELYSANCASCHGRYAEGDGPAAVDASRSVPDLRYLAARNSGVFPRDRVADVIDGREIVKAHGDRLMPVWGQVFAELDETNGSKEARAAAKVQALVDYLVEIQQRQ